VRIQKTHQYCPEAASIAPFSAWARATRSSALLGVASKPARVSEDEDTWQEHSAGA
jgi:hypothetical protein